MADLPYGELAVSMNKIIKELEQKIQAYQTKRDEYIKLAIEAGERQYDNMEFYVRYMNGKRRVPSPEMLETLYPDKYAAIRKRQIEQYRVKLTKEDLEIEFGYIENKKDRDAMIDACMIEFDQPAQYLMRESKKKVVE